jgi:glutathionylspermidine amidase/synthetase
MSSSAPAFLEVKDNAGQKAPFGACLGTAFGSIPVFSSDYRTAKKSFNDHCHKNGDLFYGYKWQCVEFARRWLIHTQGITFGSVNMAYEIFDLKKGYFIRDPSKFIQWINITNGSSPIPPQVGAVLIWHEGGQFRHTGHVGIVVQVSANFVRIAEQNFDDRYWPKGQDWSRQLVAGFNAKGNYVINESYGSILGWKNYPPKFQAEPLFT